MTEPDKKSENQMSPYLDSVPDGKTNTNDLADQESNPDDLNNGSISEREETANSGWNNKFSGDKKTNKTKPKFSFLKKKGPLTAIIFTILGGGIGISTLLSPSLLLIHLKEIMVDKFNTQLTSMDIRTNKILKNKFLNTPNCKNTIICKFSKLSDYQIDRMKKVGINVEIDSNTNAIRNLKYEGIELSPSDFSKKIDTDARFRSVVNKAYSPKFAGFADKIWNGNLLKLGLSEGRLRIEGDTPEEKLTDIQSKTKNSSTLDPDLKKIDPDELETVNGVKKKKYPLGELDPQYKIDNEPFEKMSGVAKEIADGASEVTNTGVKAFSRKALNFVKITGIADDVCTVYTTSRAVGFAAKTARALQLASFFMLMVNFADQTMAGASPDPEDISYLGSMLTTEATVLDNEGKPIINGGKVLKQTATDSFGYKYAAYGEIGTMPFSANQFLAGGGFAGSLISITSIINSSLGGSPKTVCKTLNNIFVQIGSAIAGVGAAILSGGASFGIKAAAQITASVALAIFVSYLPTLLKDIIAGVLIDENTVGGLAGDAMTSGAGVIMSKSAAQGGNAPLTKEQAVAYNNKTREILAKYAEEDRLKYSPTDITNSNTFLGNFVSRIIPHTSNMSSPTKTISSTFSLIFKSFSSLSPTTKAADISEYSLCDDPDYTSLNLAADPFCNLVYGIPIESLENIEPTQVIDKLLETNNIDGNGTIKENSELYNFQKDCINRVNPIGYTGKDYDEEDGSLCLIDAKEMNKYFYLFLIDQRIQQGMDGEDKDLAAAYELGLDENIAFYDGSGLEENNIADNNLLNTVSNFLKNPFGLFINKNETK